MATYTASATIFTKVAATYTKTNGIEFDTGISGFDSTLTLSTSNITKVWTNSYTAQSGAVTLDLAALTDTYGQSITFTSLKGLHVYNNHASATLVVGGGANPALGTDQYTVTAGKILPVSSVFTIDGTHKNLVLTPSASMSFQVILLGS
jgi:hypothetical protein